MRSAIVASSVDEIINRDDSVIAISADNSNADASDNGVIILHATAERASVSDVNTAAASNGVKISNAFAERADVSVVNGAAASNADAYDKRP